MRCFFRAQPALLLDLELDVLQQTLYVLFRSRHVLQRNYLLERVRKTRASVVFQKVKIAFVVVAVPALEHDLNSVGAWVVKLVVGARPL